MFLMGVANKKMLNETLNIQADVRREIKQLQELKRELKKGSTHDNREKDADSE
jgi:hypothetical protein